MGALLLEDLADVVAGGARQRQRHRLPHLAPAGADPIQRLRAPCVWGEGLGSPPFYFTGLFGGVEKQEQDHEGGRWPNRRGRAALFSAARLPSVGGGSLLPVAGRVCGTGRQRVYSPPRSIAYSFRCLGLNFGLSGFGRGRLADFSPTFRISRILANLVIRFQRIQ